MGLFDFLKNKNNNFNLNFEFTSSDHIRYEYGNHVSGPHGGARRLVKIESKEISNTFEVTIFNLDGNHPIWRNNIQMTPKQMKIINQSSEKIELRGFGYDSSGSAFADYGLTVNLKNGILDGCVLHMHDRGINIEYLK